MVSVGNSGMVADLRAFEAAHRQRSHLVRPPERRHSRENTWLSHAIAMYFPSNDDVREAGPNGFVADGQLQTPADLPPSRNFPPKPWQERVDQPAAPGSDPAMLCHINELPDGDTRRCIAPPSFGR